MMMREAYTADFRGDSPRFSILNLRSQIMRVPRAMMAILSNMANLSVPGESYSWLLAENIWTKTLWEFLGRMR